MCAICSSLAMQAQDGIIKTRPANSPDGKILTMEETILSRSLAPEDLRCRWIDDSHLAIFKDGRWQKYDIRTESTEPYRPDRTRPFAYGKEKSLYLLDKDSTSTPIAVSQDSNIIYGQSVSRNEFGCITGATFT